MKTTTLLCSAYRACGQSAKYHACRTLLLLSGCLTLAACGTMQPTVSPDTSTSSAWPEAPKQDAGFEADGRLAVKENGDKGLYAQFAWRHFVRGQMVTVSLPLGISVGAVCRDSDGSAILKDARGNVVRAKNTDELSQQFVGVALPPFDAWSQWLTGHRAANAPYRILPDGSLQQYGWTVLRRVNADGTPAALELSNAQYRVRLVVDGFSTGTDVPDQAGCAELMGLKHD